MNVNLDAAGARGSAPSPARAPKKNPSSGGRTTTTSSSGELRVPFSFRDACGESARAGEAPRVRRPLRRLRPARVHWKPASRSCHDGCTCGCSWAGSNAQSRRCASAGAARSRNPRIHAARGRALPNVARGRRARRNVAHNAPDAPRAVPAALRGSEGGGGRRGRRLRIRKGGADAARQRARARSGRVRPSRLGGFCDARADK